MFNNGSGGFSSPNLRSVTFVTFSGNSAKLGGALYNDGNYSGNSVPVLEDVYFYSNFAGSKGGGMFNNGYKGYCSPTMTNIIFSGNSADTGGAILNDGRENGISSPTIINVLFFGNSASEQGGAVVNRGDNGESSPKLINVTFSGNSAQWPGGAMYSYGVGGISSPSISNSIVWNNIGSEGSTITNNITGTVSNITATVLIAQSLIQGAGVSGSSWISGTYVDGGGNIDEDPLFLEGIDPSTAPTTTGNLRLQLNSPVIDEGENDYVLDNVTTDLDGAARIQDGNADSDADVDMGACESGGNFELSVTTSGDGSGVVTSTPPGIDCSEDCSGFFSSQDKVALTASADEGSVFTGWSGDCSGSDVCAPNMDADRTVNANFDVAFKFEIILPLIYR